MPKPLQPARFTGREDDIDAVLRRLDDGRLVTLTGCGGIGKTTLAGEVFRRIDEGPTAWVDLSLVSDGAELGPLLARTLNIAEQSTRSPAEQVERYLRTRPGTLVMDNCEHLIEAVTDLTGRLLDVCPGLRVLATSTQPLGLPDELIYDLPPLDLPRSTQRLDEVRQSECVRLLIQRVRQIVPEFDVTEANRADVVELCQRLDGLPLAIELAATRLRVLSVAQLVDRLDQRFGVLTGGSRRAPKRHQTLRALVEGSLERCSPEERLLWGRLSVFPGSFRLETAEQVCGFGGLARDRVLDVLTGLVARSLVVVDRAGDHTRYRQLATIRDYGAELLTASGEGAETRSRLLRHYLTVTRQLVRGWCGPDQGLALAIWRHDHAAMLGAVAWAVGQPQHHDEAAELVTLLRYHWIAGGQLSDGRRWLDRVLELTGLSPVRHGNTLAAVAWVALIQGDRTAAREYLRQAETIAVQLEDSLLKAYVDAWMGLGHLFAGELPAAIARYARAIAVFEQNAELGTALTARFQLAMAQTLAGDHAVALESCATGIEISRRHGELWNRAYSLWVRSLCHWQENRVEEAELAAREALEIQTTFEDGICVALELLVLCWIAVRRGEDDWSRRLALASDVVWGLIGTDVHAFGPNLTSSHERLTPPTDMESASDRPRTKAEAVAEGLAYASQKRPGTDWGLTKREEEILPLLVLGRSNKAIADELVISIRTVEGHVRNILAKLGLATRAEVPAWHARTTRH